MTTDGVDTLRDAMKTAARAIIDDLSSNSSDRDAEIDFEVRGAGEGLAIIFTVSGIGMTVPIGSDLAVDWRVVAFQFADLLQDTVIEEVHDPRPRCPNDGAMLIPDFVDSVPMWVCSNRDWSVGFGKFRERVQR